jgi:hypothetical protein
MSLAPLTLPVPAPSDLADLGRLIDDQGLNPHLSQVRELVRTARGLGISPVLCQVALDPSAPEPVRERAVARLIRRVSVVADLREHELAAVNA